MNAGICFGVSAPRGIVRLHRSIWIHTGATLLEPVDDVVFAHGKAPRAGAQALITGTPDMGMAREKKEWVGDGIYKAVGNIEAAALGRDVGTRAPQAGNPRRRR